MDVLQFLIGTDDTSTFEYVVSDLLVIIIERKDQVQFV